MFASTVAKIITCCQRKPEPILEQHDSDSDNEVVVKSTKRACCRNADCCREQKHYPPKTIVRPTLDKRGRKDVIKTQPKTSFQVMSEISRCELKSVAKSKGVQMDVTQKEEKCDPLKRHIPESAPPIIKIAQDAPKSVGFESTQID